MFAVPGWSLPADSLKAETTTKAAPATTPGESGPSTKGTGANATSLLAAAPAKKRKREKSENANSTGPQVTTANVADLWERVIEGREPPKRDDKKAKRQKKEKKNSKDSKDSNDGRDSEEKSETQKPQSKAASEAVATPSKAAPKEKREKKGDVKVQAVGTTPKPTPKAAPQTIEKSAQQESAKKEKKGKQDRGGAAAEAIQHAAPTKAEVQPTPQQKKFGKGDKGNKGDKVGKAESKFDKKNKKPAAEKPTAPSPAAVSPVPTPASTLALTLPPAPPKLTPLQASMRAKLVSARFRHLNETLYTSPSEEALRLFGESPDMFQAYHEGFRQQVSVWPENPVDGYVAEVRRRAGKGDKASKGSRGGRGGGRGGRGGRGGGLYHIQRDPTDTLPRTRGLCRLADIGCGDARLAASLAADAKKIRIDVLSFDLHADPNNPYITAAADAADLPITTGTVDVAVFCLALMGTNWLTFIEEAYRILRWKGELWVAEIKSRFAGSGELRARVKQKLKQQPVSHSVGFRRKNGIKGGKKNAGDEEEDPDVLAAALAEVDGDDDGAGATDVTAFVHALRRRGFVLDEIAGGDDGQDDKAGGKAPAVDLSNKMFVRMRFIKAAPALVGKQEVMEALAAMNGNKDASKRPKLKYHDDDEKKNADPMDDPALEAKILKPCVYKLR